MQQALQPSCSTCFSWVYSKAQLASHNVIVHSMPFSISTITLVYSSPEVQACSTHVVHIVLVHVQHTLFYCMCRNIFVLYTHDDYSRLFSLVAVKQQMSFLGLLYWTAGVSQCYFQIKHFSIVHLKYTCCSSTCVAHIVLVHV